MICELPIGRTQPGDDDANVPAVGLLQTGHAVLQADKAGLDVILGPRVGPQPQPARVVAAEGIILVLGRTVPLGRSGNVRRGHPASPGPSASRPGPSASGRRSDRRAGATGGTGRAGTSLAFSMGIAGFSTGRAGFSTGFSTAGVAGLTNMGFSTGGRAGGVTGFMTDSRLVGGGSSGAFEGRVMLGCSFAGELGGTVISGVAAAGAFAPQHAGVQVSQHVGVHDSQHAGPHHPPQDRPQPPQPQDVYHPPQPQDVYHPPQHDSQHVVTQQQPAQRRTSRRGSGPKPPRH